MNDGVLSTPFLGLPLLLAALLLLTLRVALFARAASNWSSLFGGSAALATVWLFGSVLLDRLWDALWLPKNALGNWPPVPAVIAAALALPAGVWLERRLRSEDLGPVLSGVLDGCTPANAYEWAASIGFLAFTVALGGMLLAPEQVATDLGGPLTWLGLLGAIATGGGLLAGGASAGRSPGSSTRGVLMALVGLAWCLAMVGLGRRVEIQTRDSIVGIERWLDFMPEATDRMLARADLSPEEREQLERDRAMWRHIETGVAGEYVNAQGETVLFEPDDQTHAFQRMSVLMPAMLREAADNARVFQSLWPFVALAGIALGLFRPRRAAASTRAA